MGALRITDRIDLLYALVTDIGHKTINVIIASVDFDAVGSALGLYQILRLLGGHPAIYYAGHFTLPHERHLNERYGLDELVRPLKLFKPSRHGDAFALVDSCLPHDERLGDFKNRFEPMVVIDHHPPHELKRSGLQFIWIDTEVGAASTLIIELLQRFKVFDVQMLSEKEVNLLAVLLSLGIYTDTQGLTGVHDRDEAAYGWIAKFMTNDSELDQMIGQLRARTQRIAVAFARETLNGSVMLEGDALIVNAGVVAPGDMDDISRVADHVFAQHPEVGTVIAWGIVSFDHPDLKFSVRARGFTCQQQFTQFLQSTIGARSGGRIDPKGIAMGGGGLPLHAVLKATTEPRINVSLKGDKARDQVILTHVSELVRKSSGRMAAAVKK